MSRDDLRLELIKLTQHPAYSAEEAIGRAKQYEEFILEGKQSSSPEADAPTEKRGPGRPPKSANPAASK